MKLDIRSAAIGATLAIGAGVLLSAQAAPALRAVADILAVKVQGTVQAAPAPKDWVDVKEGETFVVPQGRILVVRHVYNVSTSGNSLTSSLNIQVQRDGVTKTEVTGRPLGVVHSLPEGQSALPDGMWRFQSGEAVTVLDINNNEEMTAVLTGYLAPAQ